LRRKGGPIPGLDLLPHWLEVPLRAVDLDCEDVNEAQALGVLREHGYERAWRYDAISPQINP